MFSDVEQRIDGSCQKSERRIAVQQGVPDFLYVFMYLITGRVLLPVQDRDRTEKEVIVGLQ